MAPDKFVVLLSSSGGVDRLFVLNGYLSFEIGLSELSRIELTGI